MYVCVCVCVGGGGGCTASGIPIYSQLCRKRMIYMQLRTDVTAAVVIFVTQNGVQNVREIRPPSWKLLISHCVKTDT